MKLHASIFFICFPLMATADLVPTMDTKFKWSYGALADTMLEMRNNCEITHKDEFLGIGNWVRNNGAYFSLNELKQQCVNQPHPFHEINRDGENPCPLPSRNCDDDSCSEKEFTNISGCNIFISTFIKHNNLRAKILGDAKPGTYVKQVMVDGKKLYKIVDVILAPNYWTDQDTINHDANTAIQNTSIYDITDGTAVDTGLHTWTNDMFFNVEVAKSKTGNVRGALVGSYIYTDVDLTNDIYEMYDKRRGKITNSVGNMLDSFPEKDFDIKAKYAEKYKLSTQNQYKTDKFEHDTNGVMFSGKVAHFDWLGHVLFGMNREESTLPDKLANMMAHAISHGGPEPYNLQQAWDIGAKIVRDNRENTKTLCVDTMMSDEEKITISRTLFKSQHFGTMPETCSIHNVQGTYNSLVVCTTPNNQRSEFMFSVDCK